MPVEVRELTHTYNKGTPQEMTALAGVSVKIPDGQFVGLIGPTGSGKSTLIQHFNGLLKPTSGKVLVDDKDIWGKEVSLKQLRQKVGLVFQYPEQQVFEETVAEDIAFGPRNLGLSEKEVRERVESARQMVGLTKELLSRSPFELSGGQLRRVAIAGVVAMNPQLLILDEPAAGLDPRGRDEILGNVQRLHSTGMTVILVSHNMEDVSRLCERILILEKGRLVADGSPREVFTQVGLLTQVGLHPPEVVLLMQGLKRRGWNVRQDVLSAREAYEEIMRELKSGEVSKAL